VPIGPFAGLIVVVLFVIIIFRKARRRTPTFRGTVGPGAAGAIYDMLNQDKRNAIELIVEQRAEERTLEHEDDVVDDEEKAIGRRP
jgi:hypothetical protein